LRAECDKPAACAEVGGVPAGGKGVDLRSEKR